MITYTMDTWITKKISFYQTFRKIILKINYKLLYNNVYT